MQQTTISKPPRVEVVDALRGFAVLVILLVHHVEHLSIRSIRTRLRFRDG